jgi:hypothetical protein
MRNAKPPLNRRLSDKVMAVMAMLQYGYHDLSLIAKATGMSVNEVRAIEIADDARIRRVAVEGIPPNRLYHIRHAIKCRLCGSRINLVPCVRCHHLPEFGAETKSESA